MAIWIQALVCLVYCVVCSHSTYGNEFSSPSDVKQALLKANIKLVNSWNDSSGLQHAQSSIGSLNISFQFPWPLNSSGTIQLPSNQTVPVPHIQEFATRVARQVGINGSLPPLQLVGVGNFGFAIESLMILFNRGNVSSIQMGLSVPGWDALRKFGFKVVQPKLNLQLSFLTKTWKVSATGFITAINELPSRSNIPGLPIEMTLPEHSDEFLEILVSDRNAVVDLSSLVSLLSARMERDILEAISSISQNITVPTFNVRLSAGLSNFSIVNVTTISTRPFVVLGKVVITNATFQLSDFRKSFQATIETCGQQFPVDMLVGNRQYLTLEVLQDRKLRNMSISIKELLFCVEKRKDRLPDTGFLQLNASSPGLTLRVFKISYRLRPKLQLAKISILVELPSDWNIFSQASVPTKLTNLTSSVRVTVPLGSSSPDIKAQVLGQVLIGHPTLLDFPFVIDIPTKAKPLTLSLQDTKMMRVNFGNILRLGGLSSAFPSFLKTLLTDVLITKFRLQFSSRLTGSFDITEFEMIIPSRTKWNFPFFYLGKMRIYQKFNQTLVSGHVVLGNFSLPCHLEWPPLSQGPVIELSKSTNVKEVSSFVSDVYRAFFGSKTLHEPLSGLQRTKLSVVSGFSLEKARFHLTKKLSLAKVKLMGSLQKYSWELLDDFFSVDNVTFSVDVEVGRSFAISIRGVVVLVNGSVNIPFELNVPFLSNQTLSIRLPKYQEPRIPFKQLTGILTAGARSKFPSDLGSFLPELILQNLAISFDEQLKAFEIDEFRAVCSTSWDLGGIGILKISNVTVSMTRELFKLNGVLLLGSTNLGLELRNTSAGQAFRLLKPTNASELDKLIKDAFAKMLPNLKRVPDARLIDLNMLEGSAVQFAEVQLSNHLESLNSFGLKVKISKGWSFFQSCCSLIAPTINLYVKDLNDVPSYTLDITASLEFADNNNRLILPLQCNIPDSIRSDIKLKLTSPVVFNLSKIAALPIVGKLIPPGLLTPISDFIGNVRLWPLEAHFEPRTARMKAMNLTATALKQWSLKEFPLTLENITLDLDIVRTFYANLRGMFVLMSYPISFQIPFSPSLPRLPEMRMGFEGFPDITMTELGVQLIGGFSLEKLFPPVFDKLKISLKVLNLQLLPPLSKLEIQGFTLSYSLKHQVTLIDNWLKISDINADLSVRTVGQVSVAGRLSCLITIGTGANVIQSRGFLTMPHLSSQAWQLDILSGEANQLSAANIVALMGGGFDLKSLFPKKILSKAEKFKLNSFNAAFHPSPRFHVFNITCTIEANLSDVWLPLGLNIQHVRIKLFVENPFDAAKRKLTIVIYAEIQVGKAVVPTVLSVGKNVVRLLIENLKNQPLGMSDLATLIGRGQLLRIVPAGFLNFNMVTLNRLSITFSRSQFEVLNANIRCDLHGFDVGFSFPLPLPDPSNIFKANLAVRYLELNYEKNKDWKLTAGIKASFTGIPLEKHFSDLDGLLTVTPRLAMLIITKKMLDVKDNHLKLAGLDCSLDVKFADPKIVFSSPKKPELGISLNVSGFDALNKLLPFKVFKDRLAIDVLITEKRGLAIKLKTIPVRDKLIPCKEVSKGEEYICDFTWICQKDSYVRLKLPSLAYTKDGYSAIIDVQGLDKLCIPLMLPFMRKFFQDIPFLGKLLDKNIPLWPPPDIIGSLKRLGCDIDNLPRGMERFRSPEFPREITVTFSVAQNGPLTFSLEVQNDESVDVAMAVSPTGDLGAISLRRLSVGVAFNVPFVDINSEAYLWDLKFLILLSRLPKRNPLLINAAEMETHIICRDCFIIIVGYWPIPIFAAPFSIKYPTLTDVTAQATIYHRRPDFRDFSEIASLLGGLLKYYSDRHYLLSLEDLENANSTFLVLKLSHKGNLTMIQLPKYTGSTKLKLDVPPIDGKRFLVGWMNFMKTFEPKWLLQIVPLKYRVLDIAFNIGPFKWSLLKFAASSPKELKQNKALWPYRVKETGDDALLIASSHLPLLSIDATFRMKNFGNAGLSFALEAGITRLVTIGFHAVANINLESSSDPLMISAKGELKLLNVPLLAGEIKVTKDTITVVGQLNFNLLGIVRFGGMVEAAYGPGLVFFLDASVDLRFIGVRLLNSHLTINETVSSSVVRATAQFMGSEIRIELIRRGLSLNVQAHVEISIHLKVDLGKIRVFGVDIGRIVLSTGFHCDLKISFPGRSSLKISFHFMDVKIKLASLTFNTRDARPDRIPSLVIDHVKNEAPALIKKLFVKTPQQLLRALIEGLLKFSGNTGALVKDLIKRGFKLGAELVKDVGRFLNKLVDTTKAVAKAAENAVKVVAKVAKEARKAAERAVKTAEKATQKASQIAERTHRRVEAAGQTLTRAVGKVIRLENVVKEAQRVLRNVSRELRRVVTRIAKIVHKIASEIARGLRNLAGKLIKTVSGWFGKRSIYRRDALVDEKKEQQRKKGQLRRSQSDRQTRVRNEERNLAKAQREEQLARSNYDTAKEEALRSSENLRKAIKDKADKVAVLEEIRFKGKCLTGEHNCHPNATCLRSGPDGSSFKCVCRRGWIGDGVFCERPIKSVVIISDSPKAVGEEVSFASFALEGTNVQYSYSFNRTFSEYGFTSLAFSSPGVYVVQVLAKNNVSNSTASEVVVVQIPVSNVTLKTTGDRRACREVNFLPSAKGTNFSFSIDFGDNTSLSNVTESASHYFTRSGEFIINVTASNLVGSSSKTFVLNISSTPCDRLFCAFWEIEVQFPDKSLTQIASLAWSLSQSSEANNKGLRHNKNWKYLSLYYPVSYSMLKELNKVNIGRNLDRQYNFAGSHIEIDFILAGILSSRMKNLLRFDGNESSYLLPYMQKPLSTFTWITATLLDTAVFISTWNTSREMEKFCQERLEASIINSAVDGFNFGVMITNVSENERLSHIIHDYYCPSNPHARHTWKTRYLAFFNSSEPNYEFFPTKIISTLLNSTSSLEGFVSPIKELCISHFVAVLLSKLNISVQSNSSIERNFCQVHSTCQQCVFSAMFSHCFWCESSQKCLLNTDVPSCNQSDSFFKTPCPERCHLKQKCTECVSQSNCGWCESQIHGGSSFCTEGTQVGPQSLAMCSAPEWHYGTCASSCPVNQKRVCSGNGICRNGQCRCVTGFYGKDCSKRGCVYRTRQNDTLSTISMRSNVSADNFKQTNIADIGSQYMAVNSYLTIPKPGGDPNCVNRVSKVHFHELFPRILRKAKNKAGLDSFCGIFGSIESEGGSPSPCKTITNREKCLKWDRCAWNIREPCTGMLLEGCFRLTHWLDLLVNDSEVVYSPISGNIKIRNDAMQITGWPQSEWHDYIVTVSHFRPYNITSVQSGQVIGIGLSKKSPVLPSFVRVNVAHRGIYKDPLAFLVPCSPGCSQVVHFYNGICDQACNTEECDHDNGECISHYSRQSDFTLGPGSIHGQYTISSLNVLYHLQTITGEKSITVARGPISVYSLAKLIVLEILSSSDLHSSLVYKNYKSRVVKFVELMMTQNNSVEKMVSLTAKKLIELGAHNVSPHGRSGLDYDVVEISPASLQNETNFQTGLEVLMGARLLDFTLVQNHSRSETPYFHLQIPRESNDDRRLRHYDPTLETKPGCDSLNSCSGHGVCLADGSCKCDLFHAGRKCQMNNCPGRCSGHGTCIEGVCACSSGWEGKDCSKVKLCTPLCPESWIGDGRCDAECDVARCLHDKGDCENVCICPKAWLGDGSCDQVCNNTVCKYDGGDCIEVECSPGCKSEMLADDFCDHECNTQACELDKGDCKIVSNCSCDQSLLGNGMCDEGCNIAACLFDYGDCTVQVVGDKCPPACSPPMIGNGFCDLQCNESSCKFDGGDCGPAAVSAIDLCFEGCLPNFRGDGVCDSVCNVKACDFDDGDCPKPVVRECAPDCRMEMVGDETCQSQCQVAECSFDAKDCQCAPGCLNSTLGDGICNSECFVKSCDYDNMDCMCPPKKCPKSFVGNGHCDVECNNKICDYDGGDCTCSPGCSVTSVSDGSCDPACDTKICHFDGLDCGGCESESHLSICDENAYCIVNNKSLPFVRCQCKSGFYGDGFSCIKRGNCFNGSDVCSVNGKCIESNGTFECFCNPGWVGNGVFCENVDECKDESHNCNIHAKCVDLPGKYMCVCEAGWTGDGLNCTDINECRINEHSCCANEDCANTEGNYTCACKDGWRENVNSSSPASMERCVLNNNPLCVDVDECTEELHNCSTYKGQPNAICTNTIGGFQCHCTQGWQGDGYFCSDINECVNGSVCGINQICRNTAGNYSCICKEGWKFIGLANKECHDVDECTLGLDDCDSFATCINTNGSFTCECKQGFEDKGRTCTKYQCSNYTRKANRSNEGNVTQDLCTCVGEYKNTGRTCVDVDECKWNMFNCPPSAPVCQNVIGGYECKCDAVGNSSCDSVNPCAPGNNTCKENMTCIAVGLDHYCVCPEGYTLDQNATACIDIDECLKLEFYGSCDKNADCVNFKGGFECKCRPGFFQSGSVCFEIDECQGTITQKVEGRLQECKAGVCASAETCIYRNVSSNSSREDNTTLVCACEEGNSKKIDCLRAIVNVIPSGDNFTTVISIPWYLAVNTSSNVTNNQSIFLHNCSDKAVCSNVEGAYNCICQKGFESDDGGWTCQDVNECLRNGSCHSNATCFNTEGSFYCNCKSGFTGNGFNCSDVDECFLRSVNCTHNSYCVNTIGGYICACLDGFHRNHTLLCEDLDECLSSDLNNCHPRASCHNFIGGYNCSCIQGYSGNGFTCSDINECQENSSLCGEHASCYNTLGSYRCKCNPGWTGDSKNCTNIDECALRVDKCIENSYCIDNQGSYTCSCYPGWKRQWFEPYGRCSRCDPKTFCSGHGQCLRNGTCDCLSYYFGHNCSVCNPEARCSGHGACDFNGTCYCEQGWTRQPLDCSVCSPEKLCSGHGKCNYNLMTYKNQSCFCDDAYFGNNCSNACPTKEGEICGPHGKCNHSPGAQQPCVCSSGYQWNDSFASCGDTDECLLGSHHCLPPARCINTPGSYRCECPSLVGWSFDGRSCNDTDECEYPNVCDPQATCINYPGGFNCSCNIGWRGQGDAAHPICFDIDECGEGIDKCPGPSTCINTAGSYYCVCHKGWEKVSEFQCLDINECSRGIHGCDPNSTCVNTPGSWKCVCNKGWYPVPKDARFPTCKDVNECVDVPNSCPVQSTCVNTVGSYHCICLRGWRNRGPHHCVDINECSEGSYRCPPNSRCVNTPGSYQCHCNSGYKPRITTSVCLDINECSIGSHNCASYGHAYCVNTPGSYTCRCHRCYFMSGRSCNRDCRQVTRYYYVYVRTYYTSYYYTSCGWHGLSRCKRSRRKSRQKRVQRSRQVWVANRPGARCPCS